MAEGIGGNGSSVGRRDREAPFGASVSAVKLWPSWETRSIGDRLTDKVTGAVDVLVWADWASFSSQLGCCLSELQDQMCWAH